MIDLAESLHCLRSTATETVHRPASYSKSLALQPKSTSGYQYDAEVSFTFEHIKQDLQNGVTDLVQGDGRGEVQAYVVLALRPGNGVTVVTSKEIQSTVQPLMQDWASEHLRRAHELSGFFEEGYQQVEDPVSRYTNLNDAETLPGVDKQDSNAQTSLQRQCRVQVIRLAVLKPKDWTVETAFRIDNDEAVTKTLLTCLWYLQQTTLKKIAKDWIKGICPRKQAKYPYRNKKGEECGKVVAIPPWWPSEDCCIFREPDHVDRGQRLGLLLHLMRLRPTPEQFEDWNRGKAKHPVKTNRPGSWVAFLKELAPVDIIDELYPAGSEKAERRKRILETLYFIAQREEEYKEDIIDGDAVVQPLGPELKKVIVRTGEKRARQSSVESSTAADDEESDPEDEDPVPVRAKKARTVAKPKDTAKAPTIKPKAKATASAKSRRNVLKANINDDDPMPAATLKTELQPFPFHPFGIDMPPRYDLPSSTLLNTSFGTTMSDASSCDPMLFTPASPMSDHGRSHLAHQLHEPLQCHQLYDVPQPQFATTPNTPTFAPNHFLPFEQQHPTLGHDLATLSLGMPGAVVPQQDPRASTPQPTHGLPNHHHGQQYKQWPNFHQEAFPYNISPGTTSAQAQHAGFAIGPDPSQPGSAFAAPFHPRPHVHGGNDVGYDNPAHGAAHELPPASLPASVERGFTGHASGVGDSACPPGYPRYYS